MNNGFSAGLLTALILTMLCSAAMATQEPLRNEQSKQTILPKQTEAQPKPGSKATMPATGSRGELLYENNCQVCHTSVVHVRENRRARSLKDLEHWVKHWSGVLKLPWGDAEVSDVVDYLNRRYYKIEVPPK